MAEAPKKQYRTILGVVQFDPREGQAGGKDVRNIAIRTHGVKEQSIRVSATLWPSHAHVDVQKGDAVIIEGAFSRNTSTTPNEAGDYVTYNNVSVSGILNLGPLDSGEEYERVNAGAGSSEPESDDDIPY